MAKIKLYTDANGLYLLQYGRYCKTAWATKDKQEGDITLLVDEENIREVASVEDGDTLYEVYEAEVLDE